MEKISALQQLSAAYDDHSESSENEKGGAKMEGSCESSDSEPVRTAVTKAPCQVCTQAEHKYRCPACLALTCSLACVKAHKEQDGCSGIREKTITGGQSLKIQDMSVGTIKGDMKMLEQGINLSNKAKKENCLAKVGASLSMGIRPLEPSQMKKVKNLKQFLRKKRSVHYFTSPSPFFNRNKLNKTYIRTQEKPPCVYWTCELKFYVKQQETSDVHAESGGSWAQTCPIAEVVLHNVAETTKLHTLLSTKHLVSLLDTVKGQDEFNLWVTDPKSKEDGGHYAWSEHSLAIKRLLKAPKQSVSTEQPDEDNKEEGELEEGEMPADEGDDETAPAATGKQTERQEATTVELQVLQRADLDEMSLSELLVEAYVQEFPTLYIGLPLIKNQL